MGMNIAEVGEEIDYPAPESMHIAPMTVKDYKINTYDSGKMHVDYLLDDVFSRMVEEMHKRVAEDRDNIVLITGNVRTGKSALGLHIAKLYDPNFDIEKGYCYDFATLLERATSGQDWGQVFWLDEATNVANKYDWMRADSQDFNKLLEMMGSRHWLLILCLPQEARCNEFVLNTRVNMLLYAEERSWENDSRKRRGYAELTKMIYQRIGKPWRETVGWGQFPPMSAEDSKLYQKYKDRAQLTAMGHMLDKRQTIKDNGIKLRAACLRLQELGLSAADIAACIGAQEQTVYNMLTKARKEKEAEQ